MASSLDIIIVNWNTGRQLGACLNSICSAEISGFQIGRIVVVDNASSDGSADGADALSLPVTVIRNQDNYGFAVACNQGAAGSRSDYILFLNPDTKLFPESLAKPVAFMERSENHRVGICGIQLVDDEGTVTRNCARFPSPALVASRMVGLDIFLPQRFPSHFMKEWDHEATREVDQVMGAFFLVRRTLFKDLDGFDERFFVYYEDVDFAFRAHKSGWRSVYFHQAQAYHKGGGSSDNVKAKRVFYLLRSRILYGYKHFRPVLATILLLETFLLEFGARLVWHLAHRSWSEFTATLEGYARLSMTVPNILKRRRLRPGVDR